jgi:hypothetical protein
MLTRLQIAVVDSGMAAHRSTGSLESIYFHIYLLTESSLGYQSQVSSKEISFRTLNYQDL